MFAHPHIVAQFSGTGQLILVTPSHDHRSVEINRVQVACVCVCVCVVLYMMSLEPMGMISYVVLVNPG